MADDQWWNSSTGSGGVSACSTAPATNTSAAGWMASASAAAAAESTSSIRFQDSHGHTTAASQQPLSDASTTFLVDPHMDWSQDFLGGKADVASLHAAVLRDDMSHGGFPLDQASHGVSIYGGGQSTAGYEDMPMVPFSQQLQPSVQQQQGGGAAQLQFSGSYEPPGFSSASGLFGSPSQRLLKALEPKPSCSSSSTLMVKSNSGSAQDSPAETKKPRLETPSPLPTFKVRKEKLGDRITALQQLVAPFGKTDTASVLHEAIEYIKLLHDQVASLSSPYLKNASPMQLQHKGSDNAKDGGRNPRQDLRSRGLCLVPVASTYTVASEAGPEFWHPTFGGTFR